MRSRLAYLLCGILMCCFSLFVHPRYENKGMTSVLVYDVEGYYSYLPAIFIYKDIAQLNFLDSIGRKYGIEGQDNVQEPNGNRIIKYSAGMACMYFPFFITAHMLAEPLGYPADGFSKPYQFAIHIGGLLVSLLGLWYLRKLLLLFYSDTVTAISLLLLVFGTNYLAYGATDAGMSHCWLFTIYVFLLLNTHYFYLRPSYKYAIRIGLLIGLAALTRPTEIIAALIPLLWGLRTINRDSIKERAQFALSKIKMICMAGFCAFAVLCVQLIYWKYSSGHWFVYSYKDQGFSFMDPHLQKYIFSFQSGWLTYTPVMYFAVAGIIPFVRNRDNKNTVAILAFWALNLYIVSSWDIYWYGGRAMVQSYPVLMLPLAAFVQMMLNRPWQKWVLAGVSVLLVYYNIWYVYQRHYGGLYNSECMTEAYFWKVVGRWHADKDKLKLLDTDELFEGEPKNMQVLYVNNFDADSSIHCPYPPISGTRSLYLDQEHQRSPVYNTAFAPGKADWVRAKATFRCTDMQWDLWHMSQFFVQFSYKGKVVKDRSLRVYRFLNGGETKDIYIDIEVPNEPFDSAGVWFNHCDNNLVLLIDELSISSFNE